MIIVEEMNVWNLAYKHKHKSKFKLGEMNRAVYISINDSIA